MLSSSRLRWVQALLLLACGSQPPAAPPVCPSSQVQCGDVCATLPKDPANCGACGKICGSDEQCANGACRAIACSEGTTACVNDAGSYCASVTSDNENCGACGVACKAGNTCADAACVSTCVSGTYCASSNRCVDLTSDSANCGACDVACIGTCVASTCVPATSSIAAGDQHTCVVLADKTVWCWGANWAGQLGDGTKTNRSTPVQALGVTADTVSANGENTCAYRASDESVTC